MQTVAVLLCVLLAAGLTAASPATFRKTDDGWNKVSSRALLHMIMKGTEWKTGSASWPEGTGRYSDDEDEAANQLWENSGDDRPDHDKDGVCVHRSTLHTMERGSIEIHHSLCQLCVCQPSGTLHCMKIC